MNHSNLTRLQLYPWSPLLPSPTLAKVSWLIQTLLILLNPALISGRPLSDWVPHRLPPPMMPIYPGLS